MGQMFSARNSTGPPGEQVSSGRQEESLAGALRLRGLRPIPVLEKRLKVLLVLAEL